MIINKLKLVTNNNRIEQILINAENLEKTNNNREALLEINKLRNEDLTTDELQLLSTVEIELANKHTKIKQLDD